MLRMENSKYRSKKRKKSESLLFDVHIVLNFMIAEANTLLFIVGMKINDGDVKL